MASQTGKVWHRQVLGWAHTAEFIPRQSARHPAWGGGTVILLSEEGTRAGSGQGHDLTELDQVLTECLQ